MYIYVCMYRIYIRMYIHIYVSIYVSTNIYIYAQIYIYIYIYTYVYIYVYIYTNIHIFIYIPVYIHRYIHTKMYFYTNIYMYMQYVNMNKIFAKGDRKWVWRRRRRTRQLKRFLSGLKGFVFQLDFFKDTLDQAVSSQGKAKQRALLTVLDRVCRCVNY